MKKLFGRTVISFCIILGLLLASGHAFLADTVIDFDKNTSTKEAETIKLNTEVNGFFEVKDDKDFYVFTLNSDGKLTFKLTSEEGTYLSLLNEDKNVLKTISVRTWQSVLEYSSFTMNIKKGTYYFQVETVGNIDGYSYDFSTEFVKKGNPIKVMWGKTELKVGQIGKVTILSDTPLVKLNNDGTLTTVRTLKKGEEYRVYSYKGQHNGLYGVGGGNFIQKNQNVKYETPSKAKLALLQ